MPTPLYDGRNVAPAYQLRYGWTGWAAAGHELPTALPALVSGVREAWDGDGLRLLEHRCAPSQIQLTFSARPDIAPVMIASRIKGRLEHAMRRAGHAVPFRRSLALRSIGNVTREDVEAYVRSQVRHAVWADTEFARRMTAFTRVDPLVDLSQPTHTERGVYWYNLHVVLVTEDHYQRGDESWLAKTRDQCFRIAEKKGYGVSCLSVMPDHLHMALRGRVDHSPHEMALAFQNNLAYAFGQVRLWRATYYVGTFSEYDMGAVRQRDAL